MAVRRSSDSSLGERARLDPVAPPQAHLIQPSIPGNGPHNNEPSISHHNSATDASSDERGHPPVIKITLYRLLNAMIILGVGTRKFILAMQGHSISPTILDWVLGSLYVVHLLDWVPGRYRPPVWSWFFSDDHVTPLARRLFSMVVEAMRHRWEDIKTYLRLPEVFALLPFFILLLLPVGLGLISLLFAVMLWRFVANLVFPDSPEV
ncbi:hypothetical protein BS47DRAFT_1391477 [Hydnum rufescens UP504]|uniref:Uncharacterized protein n=1 Tax=Hydnum rufescens UP504 TaxID=1448309 RepID=A0A9P6B3J1_9AGAM|nr:hypothetical protein BS47DRAFT_1391477 [Hydnum rufescens UP504]